MENSVADIYSIEAQRALATAKACETVGDLLELHGNAVDLSLRAEGTSDYRISILARMYQTAVTLELASRLIVAQYGIKGETHNG
jgi:hypothetical protein